jgi:hypothetical protein
MIVTSSNAACTRTLQAARLLAEGSSGQDKGVKMFEFRSWEPLAILGIFFFFLWSIAIRIVLVVNQMSLGSAERKIISLLQRAAVEMSNQSAEQEAKEVAYLLAAMGRRVDRETYRRVLEQVQVDIAASLQTT